MELLHDIPPLKNPNMAETSTTIEQGNGQNESLLAILHVGKELYQEMHRNISKLRNASKLSKQCSTTYIAYITILLQMSTSNY